MKKSSFLLTLLVLFAVVGRAQNVPTCNAQFTQTFAGNTVHFIPAQLGDSATTRHLWYFGDGTMSDARSPYHTYNACGVYAVKHVFKAFTTSGTLVCADSVNMTINLSCQQACALQAAFTASVAPNTPLRRIFTNTSPLPSNNNFTATWTFGDGTSATSWNADHLYANPGRYRVCLRIVYSATCIAEKCDSITVLAPTVQIPCDSARVSFTYRREASRPNRYYFLTVTNTPIASETWTITPLSGQSVPVVTLNQYNPIYEFTQGGSYRVCLRAVVRTGCVKEYCDIIQVVMPTANACLLTAFPNPAQNQVNVVVMLTQPRTINARLFNNQNVQVGSVTQQGTVGANQVTFNISALPRGIYTIRVEQGGQVCTARFEKI